MASEHPTRRSFLQSVGAGFGAVALSGIPACSPQEKASKTTADIFAGISMTDQLGKPFNPVGLIGDKPSLVLFGYEGCSECEKITPSVSAIQQKLLKEGKHAPIIVISVQPEENSKDMKTYVASYYKKGVKQFADEILPTDEDKRRTLGEQSFEDAKGKAQDARILHVVCPPSSALSHVIEERVGRYADPNDPKSHTAYITLFDKGILQKQYRAITEERNKAAEIEKLARTVAADVRGTGQQK